MGEKSGASTLVEALKREKVDVVFGLPGAAILPVYEKLAESVIRHILVRHEQTAAHMADGYARASGRAGVCFATSGPGATNLVTGLATAYMDSFPVVAVTGQVPRHMIGKDAFQETDIIGVTTPITKYNFQPDDASEIPIVVRKAFHIATTGRQGPVLIDLPKDVQTDKFKGRFPKMVSIRGYVPHPPLNPERIKRAVKILSKSKKPVVLAGGGLRSPEAFNRLYELSVMLSAPVATSFMGKGSFPENHPLSLGIIGMHSSKEANRLVMDSDVLLAVAFRFSDRTTGAIEEFCPDSEIIHIDIDEAEVGKNKVVDVDVIGDAGKALKMIINGLKKMASKDRSLWKERILEVKHKLAESTDRQDDELRPDNILKEMRELLPADAIVTTEVGQNQMWAALHFQVLKPHTFFSSGGLGTMGFGFPAAIGAKAAKPGVPVVDVAGDGSFAMTANALSTAVKEDLPVVVVILNNRSLGMVAQLQRYFYDRKYFAVELEGPDFVKLAEAYGANGFRCESLKEFSQRFKRSLMSDVATVLDVPISFEEDVLPITPPGGSWKDAIGVS